MAVSLSRSPSSVRGLWMPGVSTNTTWASGRLSTPRTWVRVVCGLSDTIDDLRAEDAVEQRRLADVRPPDERDEARTSGHDSLVAVDRLASRDLA